MMTCYNRRIRNPLAALISISLIATVHAQQATTANGGLSADELNVVAPDASQSAESVDFAQADGIVVTPMVRGAYMDAQGRMAIDVMENDNAFIALRVTTEDGTPVRDASATINVKGTSAVESLGEDAGDFETDDYGIMETVITAGSMGVDVMTARIGDTETTIAINIISLQALMAPQLPSVEDGLAWADLMQAKLSYSGNDLVAVFPTTVAEQSGKTVKISGFMTPLEASAQQSRFLLTSSPPHCYFDIPGGPAGTVEVLAKEGVEISWTPVVMEGRLETIARGNGTVYRLHDAKRLPQ
ncbi:MAG: hypothetical protein AAF290_01215 [Pseudomonadota bacterium]